MAAERVACWSPIPRPPRRPHGRGRYANLAVTVRPITSWELGRPAIAVFATFDGFVAATRRHTPSSSPSASSRTALSPCNSSKSAAFDSSISAVTSAPPTKK